MQEKFRSLGLDIIGSTPKTFRAFLRKDVVKWAKVVKDVVPRPAEQKNKKHDKEENVDASCLLGGRRGVSRHPAHLI